MGWHVYPKFSRVIAELKFLCFIGIYVHTDSQIQELESHEGCPNLR